MNTDITNLLQADEKVFWQGVISRKVLNFFLFVSLVFVFIVAGILFSQDSIEYTSGTETKQTSGALLALIVLVVGVLASLVGYLRQILTEYVVTTKRVLIKSGLFGTDFQSIYFEQMKEVLVDVGLIGKIFSVGTIKIDTGKTETYSTSTGYGNNQQTAQQRVDTRTMYTYLSNIETPYEVYKHVNESVSTRKESLYSGRADQERLQQLNK